MVQVMVWQQKLRRCPDRPHGRQRRQFDALLALAELLDWPTGKGFASVPKIAAGADVGERTVHRALRWAQDNDWLRQTTRGHGHTAGESYAKATASEWELLLPSEQPANSVAEQPANSAARPWEWAEQPANSREQSANSSEQPANSMGSPPESTPPESTAPESKPPPNPPAGGAPRTARQNTTPNAADSKRGSEPPPEWHETVERIKNAPRRTA